MSRSISRRTVLKGLGTAVALPWLESLRPALALAGPAQPVAAAAGKAPLRMAFLYIPNGAHMADWTPAEVGADFKLPYILEPLAPVKDAVNVMTGLTCDKARANGDGAGDHARAQSSFLTGKQIRKTAGADIRNGVSVDQVAAQVVGEQTRFPSLEMGCEAGRPSGNCDSGYSCAYQYNFAWRSETMPVPKEIDPKQVFERLFGGANRAEAAAARAKREKYRQSVLDFVQEDAAALRKQLGQNDLAKMDEYLTAIRELEQRIERAKQRNQAEPKPPSDFAKPTGVPAEYADHIKLMMDLLVLAFQSDQTRICTFVLANDGSNRPYKFLNVPDGHHDLSHHRGDPSKHAKLKIINHFHVSMLAHLLERLRGIREGSGTLLDNCMIVYGSGISDGNRHNHDDLPILFAGRGNGTIKTGRHLRYARETPLTNLYLSMLDRVGVPAQRLGDSTGRLTGLEG
jgi:hypothetical protein